MSCRLSSSALAFVQFLPLAWLSSFSPSALLLDGPFFDFELGFLDAVGAIAFGAGEDFAGFAFGVAATQPVDGLDQNQGQRGRNRGADDYHQDFAW